MVDSTAWLIARVHNVDRAAPPTIALTKGTGKPARTSFDRIAGTNPGH
jgi:hypothetical protein